MATSTEMEQLMRRYTAAWNAQDLETVLSYFSDTELDYSDIGLMALHMDKEALISYFKSLGSLFEDTVVTLTGVHGSGDFCVWECTYDFTVRENNPAVPYKKGERGTILNASVIHWKDGKIVKETDYAVWGNQTTHK